MVETGDILARVEVALSESRGGVVSVTVPVDREFDPCAVVFASRRADDEWFCWSEPERGFELAALGAAATVVARGPDRFRLAAAECSALLEDATIETVVEDRRGGVGLPPGAGPVWVGGFAFAEDGGSAPHWSSFPPASLTLPEISLLRSEGSSYLTVNLRVTGGKGGAAHATESAAKAVGARLSSLREQPLPFLDPHPIARPSIRGVHPPDHFEAAVAEAVQRMETGGRSGAQADALRKLVLAREVVVEAAAAHDPAALFGALREGFPACFVFCRGTREGAFLGASPELLVRRSGATAATVALAGSARRSSDPALDDHLGEQLLRNDKDRREHEIVIKRIERALRPVSVWVETAPEPGLVKVANIQHLATPIMAQLADAHSAVDLAGRLHPTPAVGAEPWPAGASVIAELEQIDRGWYAGPVGWMDATADGEFCVALRSALLRDREAHLYAGVGVVPGSDPASELAETETKLGALLPLIAD